MTPPTRFPLPAGAFARGYRRALARGIDPLEALALETDRILAAEDAAEACAAIAAHAESPQEVLRDAA